MRCAIITRLGSQQYNELQELQLQRLLAELPDETPAAATPAALPAATPPAGAPPATLAA
jgi:hypothetical protein